MKKRFSVNTVHHWLHTRINGVSSPRKLPLRSVDPPSDMQPLQAYLWDFFDLSAALCMYEDEKDEQAAFNEIYALIPDGVDKFRAPWTFLPPRPESSDPNAKNGYIGVKWREEKADHVVARVWTKNTDNSVVPNDAYVHKDSIDAMRQDTRYVYVDAPGNRDPRHAAEQNFANL